MAWQRCYWYNGKHNKYFISNLYYDKESSKFKIVLQLGKDNKLVLYANSKEEAVNIMSDVADTMLQLAKDIEFIEKTQNSIKINTTTDTKKPKSPSP